MHSEFFNALLEQSQKDWLRMREDRWSKLPTVTWRGLLTKEFEKRGDTWEDVEAMTLTEEELDAVFHASYDGLGGKAFRLWTPNFVYYSHEYDGWDTVHCVARNPHPDNLKDLERAYASECGTTN